MVVTGGALTCQVKLSGVGSQLPAASRARTRSVCMPRVRSEYCSGDVHELYAVPSRAHWKVRLNGRLSVPSKVNSATRSVVGLAGPVRMFVFGGVVSGPSSTSHSYTAGGSSITPSGFVARTSSSYVPFSRVKNTCGEVHDAHSAPLKAHSNVEPGWLDMNVKRAVSASLNAGG